jgi:hypothetical protein
MTDMLARESRGIEVIGVDLSLPDASSMEASKPEAALGMEWYEAPRCGAPSQIVAAEQTAQASGGGTWQAVRGRSFPNQSLWARIGAGMFPKHARAVWGLDWRGQYFFGVFRPADRTVAFLRHWSDDNPKRFEAAVMLDSHVEGAAAGA